MLINVIKHKMAETKADTRQRFGYVQEKDKEIKNKVIKKRDVSKICDKYMIVSNISKHYR